MERCLSDDIIKKIYKNKNDWDYILCLLDDVDCPENIEFVLMLEGMIGKLVETQDNSRIYEVFSKNKNKFMYYKISIVWGCGYGIELFEEDEFDNPLYTVLDRIWVNPEKFDNYFEVVNVEPKIKTILYYEEV